MILYVPGEYASIQEAVDSAKPGDVVKVTSGKYSENVHIRTDRITVEAIIGVEMDGEFAFDSAFIVDGDNVIINGFRIFHYRDGIFSLGDGVKIFNCAIVFNTRYGIYFSGDENIIKDCAINFSTVSGINFTGNRNSIISNVLDDNSAAGIAMTLVCNENKILNNIISGGTICISNVASDSCGNIFRNNFLQSSKFGMSIYNNKNEIAYNIISEIGSIGILLAGEESKIANNIMRDMPQGIVLSGECNYVVRNSLSDIITAGISIAGERNCSENNIITNSNIGIINTNNSSSVENNTFVDNKNNIVLAQS